MPNDDALRNLSEAIAKGLPGPPGGFRPLLERLFGSRFHKRHFTSTGIRDAYGLAGRDDDGGVPFAGMVHPDSPPSGAYGGTSVVWFPTLEHGSVIDFGIGTRGLAPDEGILTRPRRDELLRLGTGHGLLDVVIRQGLEAIGWVVDERGLGGGRELDGLAWQLPLESLWESYVESVVRHRTAQTGGDVRVARSRGTVFPLHWSDPSHRSLGHLAPDIVVRRGRTVHIYDAKYKAHLSELDEHGWQRFAEDAQEAHRADIHQVLAYASLYDADEIVATLVYPLRRSTWEVLRSRGRNVSSADLSHSGRNLRVELEGLPFGGTVKLASG